MKKFQYASNLAIHRGGIWPLVPVAPVLVLAGGTGPLSNIRVQTFYRWCSRHFQDVFTLVDPQDVGQRILPNVHVLNDRTLWWNERYISADKYARDADVLVAMGPSDRAPIQIHPAGVFDYSVTTTATRHVANSHREPGFRPGATLEFH